MIFDALFPKVFTLVPPLEEELDRVLVVHLWWKAKRLVELWAIRYRQIPYVVLRVQLDEKLFPFERNLPDLGPREGVYPGDALEDGDAHVRHGQVQRDALVVLARVHLHPVQLAAPGRLQQVQVRLRRGLSSGRGWGVN